MLKRWRLSPFFTIRLTSHLPPWFSGAMGLCSRPTLAEYRAIYGLYTLLKQPFPDLGAADDGLGSPVET